MHIFEHFHAVAAIFEDSIKLLPKNGKFLALIALFSAILYSCLYLLYNFSAISLVSDMLVEQYSSYPFGGPGNGSSSAVANPIMGIMKDLRLLLLVDISVLFGIHIVSLFTTIATVIVSAASYSGKTLSIKDLVLQFLESWIRPLITSFYTALLTVGYFFVVIILASPLLTFSITYMFPIAMVVGIVAYILFQYLNVVWILALVVSLMEENNYGIPALGKAGKLIEGKRLQGFILNIFLFLLYLILSVGCRTILGKKVMANQTVSWISALIFSCLVKILQLVVYTVLYFHCRKERGEDKELQGSEIIYKKLSTEPPFSDAA